MMAKSHIASGVTMGMIIIASNKISISLDGFLQSLILGSLLPDVDTSKSIASQVIPFVDDKLRKYKILRHRGITHGITGICAMILLYFYFPSNSMLGFGIGYATHCITDLMTSYFGIRTNDKNDKILFNIFWSINLLLIIYIFVFVKGGFL